MKKIVILSLLAVILYACGNKENAQNVDELIAAKNVTALQAKKTALQGEIANIEEALATLDVKKEEALVAVKTVKDTVFTHYLDIQGSVDTKENIIIQPEYS